MLLKKKVEVNTKEGRKMTYLEIRRTTHNESHDVLSKIVVDCTDILLCFKILMSMINFKKSISQVKGFQKLESP